MSNPLDGPGLPAATRYLLSGTALIDTMLFSAGSKWGGPTGTGATITFSFPYANGTTPVWGRQSYPELTGEQVTGTALDADAREGARQALAAWADVANLRFVEVPDSATDVGDLRIAQTAQPHSGAAAWAYTPADTFARSGDVWLSSIRPANYVGTYWKGLLMHETGHALGLRHPSDVPALVPLEQQGPLYSVLSTTGSIRTRWDYIDSSSNRVVTDNVLMTGPMLLDVAAMQYLYGPNLSFHSGDDTYAFDPATPVFRCIWDAGGNDTISVAGFTGGCTIDLREGHGSSLALRSPLTMYAPNNFYDGVNVIWIAYGATIENAVGGAGNDVLTGNAAANRITPGLGNDTVSGGGGIDTVVYAGPRQSYTFSVSSTGVDVRGPLLEHDVLGGIERLQFSDRRVALDLDGNAGVVARVLGALFGAAAVRNPVLAGIGLQFLDSGVSVGDAVRLAVESNAFAAVAGSHSHLDFVNAVYTNVVGHAPAAAERDLFVAMLASGQSTQWQLALIAAQTDLNAANIGLVGLGQSGLEYS